MAKQLDTRLKPNSCWRIVRSLTPKYYAKVQSALASSDKTEELKRLLSHYRKSEYDRDSDLKKWDEETLKRLKAKLFAFVTSALVDLGAFAREPIHRLIAEVQALMGLGAYYECLGLIEDAKEECARTEALAEWKKLLDVEIICVSRSLLGHELMGRIAEIRAEMLELSEKSNELDRWADLQLEFRLPLRAMQEQNGGFDEVLANLLRNRLESIKIDSCITTRSKILFYQNWIFLELKTGRFQEMKNYLLSLMAIFENQPWFVEEDPEQLAGVLIKMVGYAVDRGERDEAMRWIEQITLLEKLSEASRNLVLNSIILAYFTIAWKFKDRVFGERACLLFDANKSLLRNKIRQVAFIWLLFFKAMHHFGKREFQDCIDAIEEISRMRTEEKLELQVTLRVIKTICLFLSLNNYQDFGQTIAAARKFILAHSGNCQVHTYVINAIQNLADAFSKQLPAISIWEDAKNHLSVMKTSGDFLYEFEIFDFEIFWIDAKDEIMKIGQRTQLEGE